MDEQQNTTVEAPVQKKSGMSGLMIVIIVLALAGVAFVIAKTQQKAAPAVVTQEVVTPSPAEAVNKVVMEGETATDTPTAVITDEDSDVRVIKIEAGSFYFKPNVIKVKKGEKVRIELTAVDMMHDFNIDELNVKLPIIKSGSTASVEFRADTVGEFEYYCSVGSHRANGQVGMLTVEE